MRLLLWLRLSSGYVSVEALGEAGALDGAEPEFLTEEVALAEVSLRLRLRLWMRLVIVILAVESLAACATGH